MGSESTNEGPGNLAQPTGVTELRSFSDPISASLAKASLEAHGIASWVTADDCGGMYPSLQLAEGVKLLVAADQLVEADQVLESKISVTPDELEHLAIQAIPEPTPPGSEVILQFLSLFGVFLLGALVWCPLSPFNYFIQALARSFYLR